MISTLDLLAGARLRARGICPYLARGLYAMTFVESTDVPTLGIDDGWRVYANPAYIAKCAKDGTLVGEILHEVLHPTLRHAPRAEAIHAHDHGRWNGCADAELDQRIEELPPHDRLKLVDDRVRPADLGGERGMSAEELYRLPRKEPPKRKRCAGGSGAGAGREPWETAKDGAGKEIAGLSEAEGKILATQIAQDVRAHAASKPGSVPGSLLRWAEALNDAPPIPWESLAIARIAYALDARRGSHPSYARPSRRSLGSLVLPVHRAAAASIAIVIDTSASMGGKDLGKALSVVYDGCSALGRVWVVACDARAGEPVEARSVEDLRPCLTGGGGTDLPVGIHAACQIDPPPDAIVVVTDGETSWPAAPTDIPLIVVLTRPSGYAPPVWTDAVICAY